MTDDPLAVPFTELLELFSRDELLTANSQQLTDLNDRFTNSMNYSANTSAMS